MIIEVIFNYLKKEGFNVNNSVLCFDGIMILKSDKNNNELLSELKQEILDKTGFDIDLAYKVMVKPEFETKYTGVFNAKTLVFDIKSDKNKDEIEKLEKELNNPNCNEKKISKKIKILKKEQNSLVYPERKAYFEKYHAKIKSPLCYLLETETDTYLYKSNDFKKNLYENIQYYTNFIGDWIKDINMRLYTTMDFLPKPLKCPVDTYNIFRGLEVEKLETTELCGIDVLLNHFKILVNHDDKSFEYLMNWLAHLFQKPGELSRVAIVFKSEQGTGKNLIFEELIGRMLGDKLWIQTGILDKVIGRFSMISNKLLSILDEMNGKDSFMGSEVLKNLIVSPKISFEEKNVMTCMVNNCNRFVFFSNNDTPVKIELSDRRFVVFEADNSLRNNEKYFKELIKNIKDDKVVYSFYQYLLNRDITEWNSINDRPITKVYKDIQSANIPMVARFLSNYIDNDERETKIYGKDLFDMFNGFLSDGRYSHNINNTKFGREMGKYLDNPKKNIIKGIIKGKSNGKKMYKFNFDVLKKYLESKNYREKCEIIISDDEDDA